MKVIGLFFVAVFSVFAVTEKSHAAPLDIDVTDGYWDLTVVENNPWYGPMDYTGSTLHFNSQSALGDTWVVEGYFDWTLSTTSGAPQTFDGKEYFTGTIASDGSIELSGYFTDDPSDIALVNYWANLSVSGTEILNGIFSYSTKDAYADYASWSAVQVSAVPLPAAAWVFGAALIGLAGISRRRKTS